MIKKRTSFYSSSVAFIDVMACGLGAVLLLFVILDFQAEVRQENTVVQEKIDAIDITPIQNENDNLQALIPELQSQVSELNQLIVETVVNKTQVTIKSGQLDNQLQSEIQQPSSTDKSTNLTGDLIGLKIEGRRILLVVDSSSSMAFRTLVDVIIGLADSTGAYLGAGPKWAQTKKIAEWVIDQAPDSSLIQVITYSDNVKMINAGWQSKTNLTTNITTLLNNVDPDGATNLNLVLKYVDENISDATDIYFITDGLPTKTSLSRTVFNVRACGINPLRTQRLVSGECREAIFKSSVSNFKNRGNARVNVILLPMEGDPKASPLYWGWVSNLQGMLFSPANQWPSS